MANLQAIWEPDSRNAFFKKTRWRNLAALMVSLLLMCLTLCGCSETQTETFQLLGLERDFELTPCRKADGRPYRISVLDEGPPIESSLLWLKGLCEELQKMGWISEEVDLSSAPDEYTAYYHYLVNADLGDFLAFDEKPYFVYGTEEDEAVASALKARVRAGYIDAVVATGTLPGVFLKNLNLGVPMLVSFATDPVASGIIDSAENTGNENIWALVEPEPSERQLNAYYRLFQMNKLVILSSAEYEDIAGVPEYLAEAKRMNLPCETLKISHADKSRADFEEWLTQRVRELIQDGADAFLVTYAALDVEQIGYLTNLLAYQGIPYLIGDADDMVENGGLVCMSCYDYENYGHYVAQILSNVLNGQKAGDQPCVYTSSLRIVLNLKTAEKSKLLTDFAFLQSVDTVY